MIIKSNKHVINKEIQIKPQVLFSKFKIHLRAY